LKEFVTAFEDVIAEDDYEAKVKALVAQGKTREEAEESVDSELGVVSFKVDGRVLKANPPNDGQLVFLLAAMGRGQTDDSRFASIINIVLSSLREGDADYLESRLLNPSPKHRLPVKKVEEIFTYLAEEWFGGKVSPLASDSADSPQTDGTN
jgi:hypothetical protein